MANNPHHVIRDDSGEIIGKTRGYPSSTDAPRDPPSSPPLDLDAAKKLVEQRSFFCNKCGYYGTAALHRGCNYYAGESVSVVMLRAACAEIESLRARNAESERIGIERGQEIDDLRNHFTENSLRGLLAKAEAESAALRARAEKAEAERDSMKGDVEFLDQLESAFQEHVGGLSWTWQIALNIGVPQGMKVATIREAIAAARTPESHP